MAITRTLPEKDSGEGYETTFNRNSDAADVRGVYLQNDTSNDTAVLVSRDASDNMTLGDANTSTKPLSQYFPGTNYDFLLDNDPTTVNTTYTPTYTGGKVTKEEWDKTSGGAKIKTIDYTYTGTKVSTEVRKIYDSAGSVVVAQTTWTYTYTGSTLTSATMVRNI